MKAPSILLLASVCAFGQTNLKCSDGSICQKDVEPGRCVCTPTSVTATIAHCPFNEIVQPIRDTTGKVTGEACVDDATLKCGKYEHIETQNVVCDTPGAIDREDWKKHCHFDETPICKPDMHSLTEKEWQALMARLKALEDPPCPSVLDRNTQKSCPL